MVLGIFVTTGDYIVLFLIMRGDPADPLTAARSLSDYVNYIIMLCKDCNGRSPVVIYDSLSYYHANCKLPSNCLWQVHSLVQCQCALGVVILSARQQPA